MGVVLLNLICAFLLAFSLLLPIAQARSINPFAPTIMLSLGIAICFDYSLFMLSRFREEVVINLRYRPITLTYFMITLFPIVMYAKPSQLFLLHTGQKKKQLCTPPLPLVMLLSYLALLCSLHLHY